jgi:hypothetical protein
VWSRVATVQIGPRHEVAPVTMVASQIAHESSTESRDKGSNEVGLALQLVPGSTADSAG